MIHLLLGFFIALIVGLTGIGGGSFTVPALLLIVGLPAGEAVGTAFVFAGVLRLIAAPFYLLRRHVHSRYFRLLLVGAVPGLVVGIIALRFLAKPGNSPVVVIILGVLLALTSSVTFPPARAQSALCAEEFALAAVARISHRRGIGIFLRGRGSAWHRSLAELFGDGAGASRGHRHIVRIGPRGHRQCGPLDLRLDQHAHVVAVARRRRSGRGAWLLAGSKSSRSKAESGGRGGRPRRRACSWFGLACTHSRLQHSTAQCEA